MDRLRFGVALVRFVANRANPHRVVPAVRTKGPTLGRRGLVARSVQDDEARLGWRRGMRVDGWDRQPLELFRRDRLEREELTVRRGALVPSDFARIVLEGLAHERREREGSNLALVGGRERDVSIEREVARKRIGL